jgi:competence protein ComFC
MSSFLASMRTWADTALSFVYPEICQICRKEPATPAEGFVCGVCWRGVRFIQPPFCERCGLPYDGAITTKFECSNCREMDLHFRNARSAVSANEFMLDVIHRYKYNGAVWFEPFLARLLTQAASPVLSHERCDLIVPVPLYPTREREREFNQAERLAKHLGQAMRIPVNKSLLRRVYPTETQTHLNRRQRAENVRRAFGLRPNCKLHGEKIVVLDDVFTTGATTSACAKLLLSAGAADVSVWTVARGL